MAAIFEGSGVALVTPFQNGKVDTEAIKRLVEMQINAGTQAIIACGTTGEPATMTPDERELVIRTVCETANGRISVIAGTGTNSTQSVISAAKRYEGLGCAAQLVVTPYYNKTNTEGLYRHYMTIAENTELPIVIYNVPSRTGIDLQPGMLARLAKCGKFVGVKESSYDLPTVMEKAAVMKDTQVAMYSGNDDMNYPLLSLGARGVVSVAANFIPGKVAEMVDSFLQGRTREALEMQLKLMPVNRALFYEVNPIPCKAAMEILGLCGGELRLPLYQISGENRAKLVDALGGLGLL
ncbi:MAG: 4-hydroxy-tetrahydrodipicolinate synthase [Clostridiales bacterium]|nr:4-hydroxy-tetrahydrodipicolinate synthase [Clostridiales bacterium]